MAREWKDCEHCNHKDIVDVVESLDMKYWDCPFCGKKNVSKRTSSF